VIVAANNYPWLCGGAIFAAMKKLLFFGVCLVALASQPVMAQDTEAEVVIVQITVVSRGDGYITITRGTEKAEVVKFAVYNKRDPTEAVAYQQVITKLYREGYSLKSTFDTSGGNSDIVTANMVFVKGQ
jgi:hypothetical protein